MFHQSHVGLNSHMFHSGDCYQYSVLSIERHFVCSILCPYTYKHVHTFVVDLLLLSHGLEVEPFLKVRVQEPHGRGLHCMRMLCVRPCVRVHVGRRHAYTGLCMFVSYVSVCVYEYMRVCLCACTCLCMCMCIYDYGCMCPCLFVNMLRCVCVYVFACLCMYVRTPASTSCVTSYDVRLMCIQCRVYVLCACICK